jgi:hypothetical protein
VSNREKQLTLSQAAVSRQAQMFGVHDDDIDLDEHTEHTASKDAPTLVESFQPTTSFLHISPQRKGDPILEIPIRLPVDTEAETQKHSPRPNIIAVEFRHTEYLSYKVVPYSTIKQLGHGSLGSVDAVHRGGTIRGGFLRGKSFVFLICHANAFFRSFNKKLQF